MGAILDLWCAALAEPKWLSVFGLGLDAIGAFLLAYIAWFRISVRAVRGGQAKEPDQAVRPRRNVLCVGAVFLVVGFAMQIAGNWPGGLGQRPAPCL